MGPEILHVNKLPGEAHVAGLQIALGVASLPSPQNTIPFPTKEPIFTTTDGHGLCHVIYLLTFLLYIGRLFLVFYSTYLFIYCCFLLMLPVLFYYIICNEGQEIHTPQRNWFSPWSL